MPSDKKTVIQRYRYDANDTLISSNPTGLPGVQRFYCQERLATQLQGESRHSIVQFEDQLFAQHSDQKHSLLATDQQNSPLSVVGSETQTRAYSPYGFHPAESRLSNLLGFNGEPRDPLTGCYHLGNGYRAFNPILMRFNGPDSASPFARGGVNAYAYCSGDPINKKDPTGHFSLFPKGLNPIKGLKNLLGFRTPSALRKKPLPLGTKSLIGFHGTSEISARSILNDGLQETFMGSNTKNLALGPGFYVSDNLEVAKGYARDHLRTNYNATVLNVYVTNIQQKRPNIDYILGTRGHEGEIVLSSSIYQDVSFSRHGSIRADAPGVYRKKSVAEIRQ